MNKLIKYDPKSLVDITIPAFLNKELEIAYNNDKITYLTLVFEDLYNNLKDANKFINDYIEFMKEWDLPFVFYPYYVYFNKNLPKSLAIPNPKLDMYLKTKDQHINVVIAPAYGYLTIDVKKLKSINFKFNESYTELYYIQDMIQKCYENKLLISNNCFIDRYNSFNDVIKNTIEGYYVNTEKYNVERQEYDKQKIQYGDLNVFVNNLKEKYNL